ncbi:LytTR family DNA-binding domain-containing protein [Rheinheimera muenzenbergensis]|uniref:LytTR family DNA-binding domain-containing protein n=1 Tax=Rheinheimera muenzenbergensis TaxID=1193628 RepID=A0ABU8C9P8_9GAMM
MRILIVDDEPLARARLKRLLAQLPEHQCVAEAENASQALQQIKQLQPDLVLLDIAMPEQDGISLGTEILQLAVPPAVIFVTAHPQHALDAYQASPVGYLLKPVAAEALQTALQKAGTLTRAHLEKKTVVAKLTYLQAGVKRQLALDDIFYFTADDKYVRMVFKQGEALIEQSLVQLQQQFPQLLVRIHRRTLINKAYFARLLSQDGRHWVLLNGCDDKLEVSRREVASLRDSLM